MKFEQLLQIYWSRGFLYGGAVRKFDLTINDLILNFRGLNFISKKLIIKRFELNIFKYRYTLSLLLLPLDFRKVLNMYFSQLTSINNTIDELTRLHIARLYLIKTYRGRAHALGKPVRGQRTWSNASTSKSYNRVLRLFISRVKKNNATKIVPEVINYKRLKKKTKKVQVRLKMIITKKKTNFWF